MTLPPDLDDVEHPIVEEARPPLVVSPVYVFRLLVGLVLVILSALSLLVFEQALIGFREDIIDIQASWPEWLDVTITRSQPGVRDYSGGKHE